MKLKVFGRLGGIAQLGERLNGIQEVSGSIPLISTKRLAFIRQVSFLLKGEAFVYTPPFW